MVWDGSIAQDRNMMKIVKDSDGDNYKEQCFSQHCLEAWQFIVVTRCVLVSGTACLCKCMVSSSAICRVALVFFCRLSYPGIWSSGSCMGNVALMFP